MFEAITATPAEVHAARAGDETVPAPDVVMDRAFSLDAAPEQVWPWLVQLGKGRAGWYLTRRVERFVPARNRAIRGLDPTWTHLAVGDVVPDYGRGATLEVASIDPPTALVYTSQRGSVRFSWSLTVAAHGDGESRVFVRLRLGPVRRKWLATSVGELFDAATIAAMAAGLRERLAG